MAPSTRSKKSAAVAPVKVHFLEFPVAHHQKSLKTKSPIAKKSRKTAIEAKVEKVTKKAASPKKSVKATATKKSEDKKTETKSAPVILNA